MGIVRRWFQNASPLAKTLMAISVTTSLVVCHRYFYSPYVRRQRYKRNEEWANAILDKEEMLLEQSENNSYESY